ncbi:MAG: ATP phosphoribosyltransferase regulatory subunit [Candidatus Caldatribacteriota bacterium]
MNVIKGFQDILPVDTEKRRICENRLKEIFEKWGYQEIDTPTLEYYDFLVKGVGPELKERMFKLLNPDGEVIVLRPDMTTPIARIAATKLELKDKNIHKYYYLNSVFRKLNGNTDDQQEFHQAGIELLGLNNRLADAEVIAATIQALINAGLKNFYIDIGSARFFNSIMDKLPLVSEHKKELRKTIMNKDFVLLEKLMLLYDMSNRDKEIIQHLPHWRGGEEVLGEVEEVIKRDNHTAALALQDVREVYQYLKIYGFERYIIIDLGIIRNFDYYTGIVFEGYTGYMGSPICGGGRYDSLCRKFGRDIPSTGAAIGIEKLERALGRQNSKSKESLNSRKYFIRYQKDFIQSAFQVAEKLRKQGNIVEMELDFENSREQNINYALTKKIRYLIDIQSEDLEKIIKYDLETKQEEKVYYGKDQ